MWLYCLFCFLFCFVFVFNLWGKSQLTVTFKSLSISLLNCDKITNIQMPDSRVASLHLRQQNKAYLLIILQRMDLLNLHWPNYTTTLTQHGQWCSSCNPLVIYSITQRVWTSVWLTRTCGSLRSNHCIPPHTSSPLPTHIYHRLRSKLGMSL